MHVHKACEKALDRLYPDRTDGLATTMARLAVICVGDQGVCFELYAVILDVRCRPRSRLGAAGLRSASAGLDPDASLEGGLTACGRMVGASLEVPRPLLLRASSTPANPKLN